MVARAVETNVPLAQDCWDHMHERHKYGTRHHTRQYFNIIQNFDIAIGIQPTRTWAQVESLCDCAETEGLDEYKRSEFGAIRTGLAHLERNESATALRTWGVAVPEKIHDPALPMSYHALVCPRCSEPPRSITSRLNVVPVWSQSLAGGGYRR
jgi:hypothetical protein